MAKRYNFHEHFEMLMVRHDYLSRVENPDPKWIGKWEAIVKKTAYVMYQKKMGTFCKVSYYLDDIQSIANCYMVSYMELYSIERNDKEKKNFFAAFNKKHGRDPNEDEIYNKEKNKLISFLRQRLQNAAVVCSRKARNIVGNKNKVVICAETENSQVASEEMLLEDHKKFGYRTVTKKEFKEIQAKSKGSTSLTDSNGFPVVRVVSFSEAVISLGEDSNMDRNADVCEDLNPEKIMIAQEDRSEIDRFVEKFEKMKNTEKKKCLNRFVVMNKGKVEFKKELKLARKMLLELKAIV